MIVAALFTIWGLFFATPAKAMPASQVCSAIEAQAVNFHDAHGGAYITDQGITNVIMSMFATGDTSESAAEKLAAATETGCPEWRQALVDYFQELEDGKFTITDAGVVQYLPLQHA